MTPGDEESDGLSADSSIVYDDISTDPDLLSDNPDRLAEVWGRSQKIRELLDRRGDPSVQEREVLADLLLRQLTTLGLYRFVKGGVPAAKDAKPDKTIDFYVLLFPGEARDNTGIKDLNDKVLGYYWGNQFIIARQKLIATIFWQIENELPPKYVTVGQDYKTASIIAIGKTRQDFASDLKDFDKKLKAALLVILDNAEKDPENKDKVEAIKKLRKALNKDRNYAFDYLFGVSSKEIVNKPPLETTLLLLTETLKGAGIARYVSKASSLKKDAPRGIAKSKGVKPDTKKDDSRGKAYEWSGYINVTKSADDIKSLMTKPYSRDNPVEYNALLVDKVWTSSFLIYKRLYFGNPDMIRDLRKKLLVEPTRKQGVQFRFAEIKELLELWLITLNIMDFVKDYLLAEYRKELQQYHDRAIAAFDQLVPGSAHTSIDWPRLEKILTRDFRQGDRRLPVLGRASEFQFYAFASDYPQQIFLMMDIRDLGVDLMTWYERFNEDIQDHKPRDVTLMEKTFESTDAIVSQIRFTYDSVMNVFRSYYKQLLNNASRVPAAEKALGTGIMTDGPIPDFAQCVQVMLGGDEVMVAAHPYFAKYITNIVKDLDATKFDDRTLNMRVGVAYSSAKKAVGTASDPTFGPRIGVDQRKNNQFAHAAAFRLATVAPGMLKSYERAQRRMERLVGMLAASKDTKKNDLAPGFARKLQDLNLTKLYARAKHGHSKVLSNTVFNSLLRALVAEKLADAVKSGLFDLVDFNDNVVDGDKLASDADKLETELMNAVGAENKHVDGPPVTKLPKWLEKLLDKWADADEKKKKSSL